MELDEDPEDWKRFYNKTREYVVFLLLFIILYFTSYFLILIFKKKNNGLYTGLMKEFGLPLDLKEWRLFINSSKLILKMFLLYNGNELPSIPIAYAPHMKETYEHLQQLLHRIKYMQYEWSVCADLKVVVLLMGLQQGFTKFCCFLCEWNSHATDLHSIRKDWPPSMCLTPGKMNVMNTPLVSPKKIILPALRIKLGIVKQLIKVIDTNKPAFTYLREKFPRLNEAKIKEAIFMGSQIRGIFKDTKFGNLLDNDEKQVWNVVSQVCTNFFGNIRSEYYKDLVHDMLALYQKFGCRMSLKLHFLDPHFGFLPS
ncbi:hypothetical protein AVEN_153975-1 [Araneus ventricosus]|uniref:Uncharacterized protein n=1 Tax=Araneus ventricosus TaxID=182803 RepID=A0A4Y2MJ01_ARAVE|nr:hypothetical protein AVEN_153975-1 [Araneus ventricosus]